MCSDISFCSQNLNLTISNNNSVFVFTVQYTLRVEVKKLTASVSLYIVYEVR